MSKYVEERVVVDEVPVINRAVPANRYVSVVNERRGISGIAIGALVVAAITAAVVITLIVSNSRNRSADEQLALEKTKMVAAQPQPSAQTPVIVTVPSPQPVIVPVPYAAPAPAQPQPADAPRTIRSTSSIEIDINSRLQSDESLRPYTIEVRVAEGTATLSGSLPDDDLRRRAEKLARTVNGVQSVNNEITIRP